MILFGKMVGLKQPKHRGGSEMEYSTLKPWQEVTVPKLVIDASVNSMDGKTGD